LIREAAAEMVVNPEPLTMDAEPALGSAIDALDIGFAYFDAADRLVAWNERYTRVNEHVAGLIREGVGYETLVRAGAERRARAGTIAQAADWIAWRLSMHAEDEARYEQHQPDGDWVEVRERRTADGGTVMTFTDIGELKRQRENQERHAALLKDTLENINQGLCVYDGAGRLLTWNQLYFDLLDLPHAFAQVGTPLADVTEFLARRGDLEGEDRGTAARALAGRLTGGATSTYERQSPDGRILAITVRPTEGGGFVGTLSDVTEARRAERKLRESEERYALAAAGANDGLWDWDLRTGRIFYSPRWKQMLGYEDEAVGDDPKEWLSRVHPDDLARVRAQLDAHLRGAVTHFESEYRMRHLDDAWRWMLTRGLAVREPSGRAYRIAGSQTDITERKRAEEQSIHDTLHDSLTGLANRTLFLERTRQSLTRSRRSPETGGFSVIYLDLDRFKVVNESLGHVHGDDLIIATSRRLEHALRFGDTVARLGGDEFAILMEDVESKREAKGISESLQKTLQSPFSLGGKDIYVTASMGVAHSSEGYDRPENILRDAELAMYRAKENGKAQTAIYEAALRGSSVTQLDLDTDLRRAVEREEMTLHYQPIISLADGRIHGFEALMRWNHADLGLISPTDFIPLAEETGLIYMLGQWVLRRACRQILDWNERKLTARPLEISVNLSGRQFSQLDLVGGIVDSLRGAGLDASCLKLEITESALMANARRSAEMLKQLKDLNIKVCVDDFGTGYSSLSYLHTFPIDTLKIDKSFVADMGHNQQNLEIVRTITMLARNLKLDVIAEGVETPEQLAQLRALGCQYAQGYLFSRPLDAEATERLLIQDRRW
jgi:diguanylate cyclase (GGDEF)-like protein/PAS domain S-box-containing protein